jgi:hypothetical protein
LGECARIFLGIQCNNLVKNSKKSALIRPIRVIRAPIVSKTTRRKV